MVKHGMQTQRSTIVEFNVFLRIAILSVVGLAVDSAAFAVQLAVQPLTLSVAEAAIRSCEPLIRPDPRKRCFEPPGFTTS